MFPISSLPVSSSIGGDGASALELFVFKLSINKIVEFNLILG